LIAGLLGTWIGWRFTFGLLALLGVVIYKLGEKLCPVEGEAGAGIDAVGAVLMALSIFLISFGCNNLAKWGTLLARRGAPFGVVALCTASFMIVCGVFVFQGFLVWWRRRLAAGRKPLMALEVICTPQERAAAFCLFVIGAITSAIVFLIPL